MLTKFLNIFGIVFSGGLLIVLLEPLPTNCQAKKFCKDDYSAYFKDTRKCHSIGSRGPCGEQMMVKLQPGTEMGICACEKSGPCSRPGVYWPAENRCYSIFEKGPCPKGQWLVPNKNKGSKCTDIPCPKRYRAEQSKPIESPSTFLFSYQDKCYMAGVLNKGPCCKNKLATIFVNDFVCTSSHYGCGYTLAGNSNPCPSGTRLDPDSNRCEKVTQL
ncbi:unnamed protein product [Allacma fusca]|uniref:DUF4789 domain-containing protein n=1 Tax=Allacma fusca TaxID=39272 RepID=A0A8J2KH14_9HEXA|nr:unnamed protein product [Allacma fusca]